MNRLSGRVQEGRGRGWRVRESTKKGGEEGVKPVDKDLLPSRNRQRNLNLKLFRERLSEKVHATILKGIVGGFKFNVL